MNDILFPVMLVTGIGIVAAVGLVVASKLFGVPVDEKASAIESLLPGANCGGCGYSGCAAYASAISEKGEKTNLCVAGGAGGGRGGNRQAARGRKRLCAQGSRPALRRRRGKRARACRLFRDRFLRLRFRAVRLAFRVRIRLHRYGRLRCGLPGARDIRSVGACAYRYGALYRLR